MKNPTLRRRRRFKALIGRWVAGLILTLVGIVGAYGAPISQIGQSVQVCDPNSPLHCVAPNSSGQMPVTGTFTASLGGFTPSGDYATLAVTDASGRAALPAGTVVVIQNVGTATAYVNLGDGSAVATTGNIQIPQDSWISLTVGSNTYFAGIADTGLTTTLTVTGGDGLPFGSVGGGNSMNIIAVGGNPVTTTLPVSAASLPLPTNAATEAKQDNIITDLGTINTTLGSPFQAGGSIGNTAFGATQSGSWTVTANAGTNLNTSALALESGGNLAALATHQTDGTAKAIVTNAGTFAVQPNGAVGVIGITPTDRSIASASGSSETLMASNAARHSLVVENTGNANCGVNPTGGTAAIGGAGTLTLYPGGAYSPTIPTLSAVTVICTAGQPVYAEEN